MTGLTWRAARAMLVVLGWTAIYYSTSAASGIWNKQLVDAGAVSPTVLTLLHLLVSLGSDMAIMRYSKEGPAKFPPDHGRHTTWDVVASFTPISVFVIMAKLSTYFSYQYVSIALSHTAKASEPIFNVMVAAAFFGEFHSRAVYGSLVPIALGVWMASVTDFTYNHTGFFWAITSALMKVLQNIYTKRLMSSGKFTFWEIHMYCGAASLAILAPVLVMQTATSARSPFHSFPATQLLMCSLLQWASSVSSYMVLHLVSHLTFTIINVMKRLVIIVSGMLVYGQVFSLFNTSGVMLSLVGILSYNIVKDAGGSGSVSALPPLPKEKMSPVAWWGWAMQLMWRYNHPGSSSGSGGGGSGSGGGAAGAAAGGGGHHGHGNHHGAAAAGGSDDDVEAARALLGGAAGDGTGAGAAGSGASSAGSAGSGSTSGSSGSSIGADESSRWRRGPRSGAGANGGGAALSITTPPHGRVGRGSGGGGNGGGGYLAGFISPLNTPFGASFYDRSGSMVDVANAASRPGSSFGSLARSDDGDATDDAAGGAGGGGGVGSGDGRPGSTDPGSPNDVGLSLAASGIGSLARRSVQLSGTAVAAAIAAAGAGAGAAGSSNSPVGDVVPPLGGDGLRGRNVTIGGGTAAGGGGGSGAYDGSSYPAAGDAASGSSTSVIKTPVVAVTSPRLGALGSPVSPAGTGAALSSSALPVSPREVGLMKLSGSSGSGGAAAFSVGFVVGRAAAAAPAARDSFLVDSDDEDAAGGASATSERHAAVLRRSAAAPSAGAGGGGSGAAESHALRHRSSVSGASSAAGGGLAVDAPCAGRAADGRPARRLSSAPEGHSGSSSSNSSSEHHRSVESHTSSSNSGSSRAATRRRSLCEDT